MRWTLLILFFVLALSAVSQYNANWYFQWDRGMNFTPSGILLDSTGSQASLEGVVTMSHDNGNLAYYSNGENVWNTQHGTMPNGTGLMGSNSAAQGVFTVPVPNSDDRYYLIYVGAFEVPATQALRYSVIDMSLDGGLGDVDTNRKNVLLEPVILTEHLVGTRGTGPFDGTYWIVTRRDSNHFVVYNANDTGLTYHSDQIIGFDAIGRDLKFSSTGRLFSTSSLLSNPLVEGVQLLRFDPQTGLFSAPIFLSTGRFAIGQEFSGNERFLYSSHPASSATQSPSRVIALDISSYDTSAINASIDTLWEDTVLFSAAQPRQMQRAINEKIYISHTPNALSVIENPNQTSGSANFALLGQSIGSWTSSTGFGLPNDLAMPYAFTEYSDTCFGDTTRFAAFNFADSVFWIFGDTAATPHDTSTAKETGYVFSTPGVYSVTLITFGDSTDTVTLNVTILDEPRPNLPDTFAICDSTQIGPLPQPGMSYLWSTGATATSITVSDTGVYWVRVANACDTVIDTVYVVLTQPVAIALPPDTTLCVGDTLVVRATVANEASITWWNGVINIDSVVAGAHLSINQAPLEIWVRAENACTQVSDTLIIDFVPLPSADWFSDSLLCDGSLVIDPPDTLFTYFITYTSQTQPLDTLENWVIQESALYSLQAFNTCDTVVAQAFLSPNQIIGVELGEDTTFCIGDSLVMDASWPEAVYLWDNGSTSATRTVRVGGDYTVTITNAPCSVVEQLSLRREDCSDVGCEFEVPNVFSPNSDGINDQWIVENRCNNAKFEIWIRNRWGQLVHYSEGLPWDGNLGGRPVADGTYFYLIRAPFDDVILEKRGTLTLMR